MQEPQIARTLDPRIDMDVPMTVLMQESGREISSKFFNATSIGGSTITWNNINPPSPDTIIDSKFFISVPYRLTFTGTPPAAGEPLLQLGVNDAPRAFPLAQSTSSIKVTINSASMTQDISRYIEPLLRYSNYRDLSEAEWSLTPSKQDQYLRYDDAFGPSGFLGTARNVLGQYGEDQYQTNRGGFSDIVVVSDDGNTAVVDLVVTEPIFVSPLEFGEKNRRGLVGIQTLSVHLNLNDSLPSYIWSHSPASGSTISNIAVDVTGNSLLGTAELMYTSITPKTNQVVPKSNLYPYHNVIDFDSANVSLTAGESRTTTIQNMQLNTVPKRVYIFAYKQRQDRGIEDTDTYARIKNISINFANKSGILSEMNEKQLYLMSAGNGLQMSWPQWSKYCGSVLCVDFAKNVSLADKDVVGLKGTFQFQYKLELENLQDAAVNYQIKTIVVEDGMLQIAGQQVSYSNGLFDTISELSDREYVDAMWVESDSFYGAGLGDFIKEAAMHAKRAFGNALRAMRKYGPEAVRFVKDHKHEIAALVKRFGPEVLDLVGRVAIGPAGVDVIETVAKLAQEGIKKVEGSGLTVGGEVVSGRRLKRAIDRY